MTEASKIPTLAELDKQDRPGTYGMVFGEGRALQFTVVEPDNFLLENGGVTRIGEGLLIASTDTEKTQKPEALYRYARRDPIIQPVPKERYTLRIREMMIPVPPHEGQLDIFQELYRIAKARKSGTAE